MLKVSLVALFAISMATLTIAASSLPLPPDIHGSGTPAILEVAQRG
jgi:hypothetical protein